TAGWRGGVSYAGWRGWVSGAGRAEVGVRLAASGGSLRVGGHPVNVPRDTLGAIPGIHPDSAFGPVISALPDRSVNRMSTPFPHSSTPGDPAPRAPGSR